MIVVICMDCELGNMMGSAVSCAEAVCRCAVQLSSQTVKAVGGFDVASDASQRANIRGSQ